MVLGTKLKSGVTNPNLILLKGKWVVGTNITLVELRVFLKFFLH